MHVSGPSFFLSFLLSTSTFFSIFFENMINKQSKQVDRNQKKEMRGKKNFFFFLLGFTDQQSRPGFLSTPWVQKGRVKVFALV